MWSTTDIIHVCRGNSPAMWTRFRINKFSDHTNKLPCAGNTLISSLNRAGNYLQAFWEKPQQFGFPSLSYTGKNLSSKLHGNSYCPNVELYFMCTVWWWLQIPRCIKLKIINIVVIVVVVVQSPLPVCVSFFHQIFYSFIIFHNMFC